MFLPLLLFCHFSNLQNKTYFKRKFNFDSPLQKKFMNTKSQCLKGHFLTPYILNHRFLTGGLLNPKGSVGRVLGSIEAIKVK